MEDKIKIKKKHKIYKLLANFVFERFACIYMFILPMLKTAVKHASKNQYLITDSKLIFTLI